MSKFVMIGKNKEETNMLLGDISRKMKKSHEKLEFVQMGFTSKPYHRGEAMIRIRSKHHRPLRILKRNYRNKYASSVWHNIGNTGCGCRTSRIRFKY